MISRTYFLSLMTATCLGMLFILGFNSYVDPFAGRDWSAAFRLPGKRSEPDKNERMFKLLSAARIHPQIIVLGTSRASHGIDPDHPKLKALAAVRFNAAFDGANIVEIEALMSYLGTLPAPRLAILGLDFMAFNHCAAKSSENHIATMISGLPSAGVGSPLLMARVLSSLDTLNASFRTLQGDRTVVYHDANGRRLDTGFEERIRERGSYKANFEKLEKDFFRLYLIQQKNCFDMANPENAAFLSFRRALKTAYAAGSDVRMIISPVHVRQLEVIRLSGLWPEYETWLRKLAEISEEESIGSGRAPFPIVDFSAYHGLVAESLPEMDVQPQEMTWYWESSHYKQALGDLAVDRILNDDESHSVGNFPSTQLTTDSMDLHLLQLQSEQRIFASEHPETIGVLIRLKCEVEEQLEACSQ